MGLALNGHSVKVSFRPTHPFPGDIFSELNSFSNQTSHTCPNYLYLICCNQDLIIQYNKCLTCCVYANLKFGHVTAGRPCEVEKYKAVFDPTFLVPKCSPDGLFEPVQCDSESCWCVSKETGEEIATTRVGKPSIPNCQCEYKR